MGPAWTYDKSVPKPSGLVNHGHFKTYANQMALQNLDTFEDLEDIINLGMLEYEEENLDELLNDDELEADDEALQQLRRRAPPPAPCRVEQNGNDVTIYSNGKVQHIKLLPSSNPSSKTEILCSDDFWKQRAGYGMMI